MLYKYDSMGFIVCVGVFITVIISVFSNLSTDTDMFHACFFVSTTRLISIVDMSANT